MAFKGFRYLVPTIEVDLTKPLEEILQNIDKDARWGVNKAKKGGLIVKEADEKEAGEFYVIYTDMCKRNGIEAHELHDIMKSGVEAPRKILVCKKDNKVIAGVSITDNKKTGIISLYVNASLIEYLKFQPNNLLYWGIIEYGKKNNVKVFDLGGYDASAKKGSKTYEINRFKSRWGGKIVDYVVYTRNPFYFIYRIIMRKFLGLRR